LGLCLLDAFVECHFFILNWWLRLWLRLRLFWLLLNKFRSIRFWFNSISCCLFNEFTVSLLSDLSQPFLELSFLLSISPVDFLKLRINLLLLVRWLSNYLLLLVLTFRHFLYGSSMINNSPVFIIHFDMCAGFWLCGGTGILLFILIWLLFISWLRLYFDWSSWSLLSNSFLGLRCLFNRFHCLSNWLLLWDLLIWLSLNLLRLFSLDWVRFYGLNLFNFWSGLFWLSLFLNLWLFRRVCLQLLRLLLLLLLVLFILLLGIRMRPFWFSNVPIFSVVCCR
jgi:hypothetical protein